MKKFLLSLSAAFKKTISNSLKTCKWIVQLTVIVSFAILLLDYFQILPYISSALQPIFNFVGLPGGAALAYVSGYFVNVYSAIAVAVTLDLNFRELTILGAMVLAAHNMIIETAVQKKTGTSAILILLVRTLSSVVLGLGLNLLLPEAAESVGPVAAAVMEGDFLSMFKEWGLSTLFLALKMCVIICTLNLLQELMAVYGVIRILSKILRPVLAFFGLPAKTALLWIVANVIGLAYGATAMIEESRSGKLKKEEVDMLNIHISLSHSNLEDLLLFTSIGGIWWAILLSRWTVSLILVWSYRLIKKISYLCKSK